MFKAIMMRAALGAALLGGSTLAMAQSVPTMDWETLKNRPNMSQTPVGLSGTWSLEKLLALTPAEMEAIWRTLPPPSIQEMNGHYMGLGPDATNPEHQKGYANYMFNEKSPRGYWLGKAFRPLTATTGEGYNRWRFPGQKIVRNLHIATKIGPSNVDGKPSYLLDYTVYNKGSTLIDELRKVDDSLYFGAATVIGPDGKRGKPDMFILIGPTDEWVGLETK